MASISTYLQRILSSVYGREVRQSLHDGLSAINDEVVTYNSQEQSRVSAEKTRASNESKRVSAESSRATAESQRVSEFQTLKNQFVIDSSFTQYGKAADAGRVGEKFSMLEQTIEGKAIVPPGATVILPEGMSPAEIYGMSSSDWEEIDRVIGESNTYVVWMRVLMMVL
ncbi:MAG: hypothetical protein ACOYJU_00780 [Anaerovoracaceae bacterium]